MPFYISGKEIADQKELEQLKRVSFLKSKNIVPKLVIIQTIDSTVIDVYIRVKKKYAEKIGVLVEHLLVGTEDGIKDTIARINSDISIHGIIIQLPLGQNLDQDKTLNFIAKDKDVDGLSVNSTYIPPTAQAVLWLMERYVDNFATKKIALVGKGRLVGGPLLSLFRSKNIYPQVFIKGDDLSKLVDYNVIISATGVPNLILDTYIKPGSFLFDAGTAEENGSIHGDASDDLHKRSDIQITPTKGGVGILTVRALFENVIQAAEKLL